MLSQASWTVYRNTSTPPALSDVAREMTAALVSGNLYDLAGIHPDSRRVNVPAVAARAYTYAEAAQREKLLSAEQLVAIRDALDTAKGTLTLPGTRAKYDGSLTAADGLGEYFESHSPDQGDAGHGTSFYARTLLRGLVPNMNTTDKGKLILDNRGDRTHLAGVVKIAFADNDLSLEKKAALLFTLSCDHPDLYRQVVRLRSFQETAHALYKEEQKGNPNDLAAYMIACVADNGRLIQQAQESLTTQVARKFNAKNYEGAVELLDQTVGIYRAMVGRMPAKSSLPYENRKMRTAAWGATEELLGQLLKNPTTRTDQAAEIRGQIQAIRQSVGWSKKANFTTNINLDYQHRVAQAMVNELTDRSIGPIEDRLVRVHTIFSACFEGSPISFDTFVREPAFINKLNRGVRQRLRGHIPNNIRGAENLQQEREARRTAAGEIVTALEYSPREQAAALRLNVPEHVRGWIGNKTLEAGFRRGI